MPLNTWVEVSNIIDELINSPPRVMTKEEMRDTLMRCGALDSKGKVVPAYRGIINESAL